MGKKKKKPKHRSPKKTYQVSNAKNFGLSDDVWASIKTEADNLKLQIVDLQGVDEQTLPIVAIALRGIRESFDATGDAAGVMEWDGGYIVAAAGK
jgi:hypothetical protein